MNYRNHGGSGLSRGVNRTAERATTRETISGRSLSSFRSLLRRR
ncbi:hypothetical protein BN903_106 [Halorubrum sp. AJ67]|nr:hypothetical protein BN903_106 [Halorubrum sp. AJ67]